METKEELVFNKIGKFRLTKKQENKIKAIVLLNQDKYGSFSHFCRVAILKEIRLYDKNNL